jgi:hypothetical protein
MYFTYSTGQNYVYTITQGVNITDSKILSVDYKRITEQIVQADTAINNLKILYRKIQEAIMCVDKYFLPLLFIRKVNDAVKVYDTLKHLRTIYIGLYEIVNIESKAKSGKVYFAKISDTVYAAGVLFRALFMFVRIITKVFISDYLLKRFLKSKTEVKLKSCIIREIVLESRIN